MFQLTKYLMIVLASILVVGTYLLSIASPVWNFMTLPLILCGLGLILAICERQQASFEQNKAQVHCLLKYLKQKKTSDSLRDVA